MHPCKICGIQPFLRKVLDGWRIHCAACKVQVVGDDLDAAFEKWDILHKKESDVDF
jgi:hypothetical protein